MADNHDQNELFIDTDSLIEHIKNELPRLQELAKLPALKKSEFFELMGIIPHLAKEGASDTEVYIVCTKAAEEADKLHDQTGEEIFTEWAAELRDYAETFTPNGAFLDIANKLLGMEIYGTNTAGAAIAGIAKAGGDGEPEQTATDALNDLIESTQFTTDITPFTDAVKNITDLLGKWDTDGMQDAITTLEGFIQPFIDGSLNETLKTAFVNTKKNIHRLQASGELLRMLKESPELEECLANEIQKPEYEGHNIDELLELAFDDNGEVKEESLYMQAMAAAQKALTATPIEKVTPAAVSDVHYPIDKPNSKLWHYLAADTKGQMQFNFNVARRGDDIKEALIYTGIEFNDIKGLQISKELTTFDKWVYITTGALFNAGNQIITTNQIYKLMGGKNNANSKDREKIFKSLQKMANANIVITNKHEAEQFKLKQDRYFEYSGHLLDARFGAECELKGSIVKDAIRILAEPVLITFAKQRKQFTTIDRAVLAMPLSNTARNLDIKDYLIDRISKIKTKHAKNKILWKTLYDHCGIKDHKDRFQNDVIKCLDYLKSPAAGKYIAGYDNSNKDGIIIKI